MARIKVFIPTLNAGSGFRDTLDALAVQDTPFELHVVDSGSSDGTAELARAAGATVDFISQDRFDHGGTRNLAAREFEGSIVAFLTQDAVAMGRDWLTRLTRPIVVGDVAACYGRQVPRSDSAPTERIARSFNYPDTSRTKSWNDIDALGVKAFFFSNVNSAVSVDAFREVGGFPERTILSEDMLLAVRLLRNGWSIRYAADAAVFHSHDYTLSQEFQRHFDIGAFFAEWRDELPDVPLSGEGLRLVTRQCTTLLRTGAGRHVPRALASAGAKYTGYVLGTRFRWLPPICRRTLSMHKAYWRR